MRKLRFLAFAVISFVAALFGALLSPNTWLHKSLAVALCGVLSANPALCTNNAIAAHSQEASATNPVKVETTQSNNLLADRANDFDTAPMTPSNNPPRSNSSRSTELLGSPSDDNKSANSGSSNSNTNSDENPKVFVFYINGIQTLYNTYIETKNLIREKLLNPINIKFHGLETYNTGGAILGDITESAFQEIFQSARSSDGSLLEDSIVQEIKNLDDQEVEKAKNSCKPRKRAKFILIGHSQGTIFINNIALKLNQKFAKDRQINQRVKLLALAPFTNFSEVRKQGFQVEYVLREDDFPALGFLTALIPRVSTRRIPHNLPCLKSDCPFKLAFKKRLKQAQISHAVENYLGSANPPEYAVDAQNALNLAQNKLRSMVNASSGEYKEKKEDCSSPQVTQLTQNEQCLLHPSDSPLLQSVLASTPDAQLKGSDWVLSDLFMPLIFDITHHNGVTYYTDDLVCRSTQGKQAFPIYQNGNQLSGKYKYLLRWKCGYFEGEGDASRIVEGTISGTIDKDLNVKLKMTTETVTLPTPGGPILGPIPKTLTFPGATILFEGKPSSTRVYTQPYDEVLTIDGPTKVTGCNNSGSLGDRNKLVRMGLTKTSAYLHPKNSGPL